MARQLYSNSNLSWKSFRKCPSPIQISVPCHTACQTTIAVTLVALLRGCPPAEASIPLTTFEDPRGPSSKLATDGQVRALEQLGFKSNTAPSIAQPPIGTTKQLGRASVTSNTKLQIQNVMSLMTQASEASDKGDWATALRCYDEIIKSYPDFALAERARVSRGVVLFQLDRKDEAVLQLEDEEVALRGAPEVHAALAVMAYDAGRIAQAEQQWEIATEFDKRYEDPEWVVREKRWPPQLVHALKRFLSLSAIL